LCYDLNVITLGPASDSSFEKACRSFELEYHMSSDEFMRRFEAGELGDAAAYFDWYAAKRGLDVREGKYHATDSGS
jgi:hypothetical protein